MSAIKIRFSFKPMPNGQGYSGSTANAKFFNDQLNKGVKGDIVFWSADGSEYQRIKSG
ncbi:hypothetical protein EMIT053CA3_130118 [Pseudomonas donghuensis]